MSLNFKTVKSNFNLNFGVLISLACYAALRLTAYKENLMYGKDFERIFDFTLPNPFVSRMLAPILALTLKSLGLGPVLSLACVEYISLVAIFAGIYALLFLERLSSRFSFVAVVLFFPLLAFLQLINLPGSFYYPADTPSLAFIVWGMWAIRAGKIRLYLLLLILGTLNRETTLLLVFLAPFLTQNADSSQIKFFCSSRWALFLSSLVIYTFVRLLLRTLFSAHPFGFFMLYEGIELRIFHNINLFKNNYFYILILISSLGFTPVLWALFRKHIPMPWRIVIVPYLMTLGFYFIVANYDEARVFGEIFLITYVAIVIGIDRNLRQLATEDVGFFLRSFEGLVLATYSSAFVILYGLSHHKLQDLSAYTKDFEGCLHIPKSGTWQLQFSDDAIDSESVLQIEDYQLQVSSKTTISLGLPREYLFLKLEGIDLSKVVFIYKEQATRASRLENTNPSLYYFPGATGSRCRNAVDLIWRFPISIFNRHVPSLDHYGLKSIIYSQSSVDQGNTL